MQFICERKKLARAFDMLRRIIPYDLQHVRIDVQPGTARFITTDTATYISVAIPADADGTWQGVMPFYLLRDRIANDKSDKITFEPNGADCCITGKAQSETVPIRPVTEFPELPTPSKVPATSIEIEAKTFSAMLRRTAFATTTEKSEYFFNGICVIPKKAGLILVATDTFRLACTRGIAKCNNSRLLFRDLNQRLFIFPKTAEILQTIKTGKMKLRIEPSTTRLFAQTDNVSITAEMATGRFPNYALFFLKTHSYPICVGVDRRKLLKIMQAAKKRTKDVIGMACEFLDNKVGVTVCGLPNIRIFNTIDVQYDQNPFLVVFDFAMFYEIVRVLNEPTISFILKSPKDLVGIRAGDDYICLIAPLVMRENDEAISGELHSTAGNS